MRITFVILHYLSDKDTIECVDSIIQNIEYEDKEIIIVDNASPNGSFENVEDKYKKCGGVILLKNDQNLGFARGNNVGFKYAKDTLSSDFIVLINNDTIINQSDFAKVIVKKYEETGFAVLGPDILTHDGYHQNPLKRREWTVCKLKMFKLKAILRIADLQLLGLGPKILNGKKKISGVKQTIQGDITNVRLHGACLIFSHKYIKKFDGLDDGTFLYMEEDLLQMQMDFYNLSMWYTSDLRIYHKEDAATNMVGETEKEKNIRFLGNLIDSINVCIEWKEK